MWVATMPSALVRVCVRMLPVLAAEDAIRAVNTTAIGTSGGGETGRAMAATWRHTVTRHTHATDATRKVPDPMLALTAHGIPVRRVPFTPKAEE